MDSNGKRNWDNELNGSLQSNAYVSIASCAEVHSKFTADFTLFLL